ncbi:hypothetical protein DUI87_23707 [Hirundo rustica rustica]|uniref:Uncharacterized protein n=1 Tax=Hirundo rustica rustica TaxID=333673 RepID=A0A3M0JFB7_HIRRU|nr:hypothetical protein DUI87_23707 [Hirundo rustica rustica]
MLKGAPTGVRKYILAAEKMAYLAAGGNPVGRGKGRGIHLWVTLVILSLAMYLTSGLPNPKEGMGKETDPQETQLEPTWGQNRRPRVHFDCPERPKGGNCKYNDSGFQMNKKKEKTIYDNPMAMSRKRRELSNLPIIPICRNCNKTVWVGGKRESTFVAYLRVNKLCYDKNKLEMCTLNGKTYWVGQNEKLQTASLNSGSIILDLLSENDERVCLKLDKIFCFSKDEEGMDPENKIQKAAQEPKRLIHMVVEGMQIASLPIDPELASGGLNKNNAVPKIMKLNEKKSRAAEVLARFEARVPEGNVEKNLLE